MTKVLLLHAYSATNAGDGLLVVESLDLLREAFGDDTEFTIAALHPRTFVGLDARIVDAKPGTRGWGREFRDLLRGIDAFDVVAGVGGGYLRTGTASESVKTLLAHGPQLAALRRFHGPIVYLPQSVGPLRWDRLGLIRRWLRRVDDLYLRDDRSVDEVSLANIRRVPDLALLSTGWAQRAGTDVIARPVLSTRYVHGRLPADVVRLAAELGEFDGYVQSTGAGNDDRRAVAESGPADILERADLLDGSRRRVVVAVRLHAALMAMRAGHWVVHLAYERKGFGAFQDLGLSEYVHNVNAFDAAAVRAQVATLLADPEARASYDERVTRALATFAQRRATIVDELRARAGAHVE